MQPLGMRRDPAPSRWAYRMNRLWLTPLFRSLLRLGLPVFMVVAAAGIYLADAERRDLLVAQYDAVRQAIQDRPEFMVTELSLTGTSEDLSDGIAQLLGLTFPVSSFALDLETMRQQVEALAPVARAELRLRSNGVLEVRVTERVPVILWRHRGGLDVLDAEGIRAGSISARTARPEMPLIAGEGADAHVAEALALFAAAEPIRERMRGLVRIGDRRWDVVLDRDQRILLPETDAVAAMERVIVLDQTRDLLARDVSVVDLRNGQRPTLRLADDALNEFRRVRGMTNGG